MTIFTFPYLVAKLVILLLPTISSAIDSFNSSQSLIDGSGTTLVSKNGSFELGFFSPSNNNNSYLGIWYNNIPDKTVVWVANRNNPTKDKSSMLIINTDGKLVILNSNKTLVWSANSTAQTPTRTQTQNLVVQLLDSGNLVLKNEKDYYLWQSFEYPCDTFLAGMKIGWNLKTGHNRYLSAWKNWDDPSEGDFKWGLVLGNAHELVMWKGSKEYYRSGPWNGVRFSGKTTPLFDLEFVTTNDGLYYTYNPKNKSLITRVVLNQSDYARQRYNWIQESQTWRLYSSVPRDLCDGYNLCGSNGYCRVDDSPPCQCLEGFRPKLPQNYESFDWTQGCLVSKDWNCKVENRDGFRKFSGLKLPDTKTTWVSENFTLENCKAKCFENCSCTAYANLDARGDGNGCIIWFGDLIDLRVATVPGQDLYVRTAMANSDSTRNDTKGGNKKKVTVIIVVTLFFVLVIGFIFTCIYQRKRKLKVKEEIEMASEEKQEEGNEEDMDLPFFEFATIARATNDFSRDKKLGQGGFGPVYMGTLRDGQEIAVKRLSSNSGQGTKEFKNEVIVCAKLQHRNLVKVLGCSTRGEEKVLVYEYMPNKSLDSFLFDSSKSGLLNWSMRFNIIIGIARGLVYLHQDSRLRIIHRDLKASNILLDGELNPKISDFGVARMFSGNQTEGNTRMVAGTYGYMAPEYAIDGLFSIKSDVFSFGVLLLEIVSGKKNTGIFFTNEGFNLLGHAWKLWNEGKSVKLIDASLRDSFKLSEVVRCIHVGLLCVQLHHEDRPNMASVILMLSSENNLPQPKEPGFLIERMSHKGESSSSNHIPSSTNELTLTLLEAR